VNDIVPTILEAARVAAPVKVAGIPQKPMDGTSLVYSFNDAKAPERHTTQYFEILGNRAIYHEGWMASTRNRARVPWGNLISDSTDTGAEVWELYDLRNDYSQSRDLATEEPGQLRRLQNIFWAEAGRNQVLPISGRPAGVDAIPALGAGRSEVTYYTGAVGIPESGVPDLKNRDHRVTAFIHVPAEGARGVLATQGGVGAGWALYVTAEGHPAYVYNLFGKTVTTIVGSKPLAAGERRIEIRFDYDGGGYGRGAGLRLLVDGKSVAKGRIERSAPAIFSIDETFDVGTDTGSPAGRYPALFKFTGRLDRVVLKASK
jgi:arylsulfatase